MDDSLRKVVGLDLADHRLAHSNELAGVDFGLSRTDSVIADTRQRAESNAVGRPRIRLSNSIAAWQANEARSLSSRHAPKS